jgi:hypothetical protein
MSNEEIRQERGLNGQSKEEGKPHENIKVEGELYTLHWRTISRKESLPCSCEDSL